jgi:hypothetical protein
MPCSFLSIWNFHRVYDYIKERKNNRPSPENLQKRIFISRNSNMRMASGKDKVVPMSAMKGYGKVEL